MRRIGWWLLGVLAAGVACSRAKGSKPIVATSASAFASVPPPLSNVPPPPTADLNLKRKPARGGEDQPLPFVFYRHEAPRVGTPAAPAFAVRSSPGGWSRYDAPTHGMLVDVQGGVWREETPYRGATVNTLVGRVASADVHKMQQLAAEVARSPAQRVGGGCMDCGGTGYLVFGVPGADKDGALLAGNGSSMERSRSSAVQTAERWLQAVTRRALQLPRDEPFGLELPILRELSDELSHGEPAAQDPVLELSFGDRDSAQGIFVSRAGNVYRFRHRSASHAGLRFVGRIEHGALARILAAAESCRNAEWQAAPGKQRWPTRTRFFAAASSEPLVISLDEAGEGGRIAGTSASLVIAWLYALDEQALLVDSL